MQHTAMFIALILIIAVMVVWVLVGNMSIGQFIASLGKEILTLRTGMRLLSDHMLNIF